MLETFSYTTFTVSIGIFPHSTTNKIKARHLPSQDWFTLAYTVFLCDVYIHNIHHHRIGLHLLILYSYVMYTQHPPSQDWFTLDYTVFLCYVYTTSAICHHLTIFLNYDLFLGDQDSRRMVCSELPSSLCLQTSPEEGLPQLSHSTQGQKVQISMFTNISRRRAASVLS